MAIGNASGVYIGELDLSQVIGNASTAVAAIVFASSRGRPNERVFISSTKEFTDEFGQPDPKVSYAHYCALAFLEEGNQLWGVRVVGAGAQHAGVVLQKLAASQYTTLYSYPMVQPTAFDPTEAINGSTTEAENVSYVYAIGPGSYAKDVQVEFVSQNMKAVSGLVSAVSTSVTGGVLSADTYEYKVTARNNTGETLPTTVAATAVAGSTAVTLTWGAVVGATSYGVYGRKAGGSFGLLATTTVPTYQDLGDMVPDSTVQVPSTYVGGDEFRFNVYDNLINPTVAIESFTCTLKNAQNGFGVQTEFATQVNDPSNGSKYVRVVNPTSDEATAPMVFSTGKLSLTGGTSGAAVTDSAIAQGWQLFADKEQCSLNILINGGYSSPTVQLAMDALATKRQDCIAILDLPASYNKAPNAVDYRNNKLNLNSSYSALYGPDLFIADTYNGTQLYVPPSGHVAGVYARTDRLNDTWFAPAGLNRGLLRVLGLREVYGEGERELLQPAQINYVRKFPGLGYAIMEAYTMQSKLSALSFVPVRRMLMVIETAVAKAMMFSLWEPNDPIVRLQLVGMISDYLDVIKNRRGVNKYLVVCDDSNNGPQTTANGTLNVDVYIEPTLPVARISLRMVVNKQGMSFQEAILMGAQR